MRPQRTTPTHVPSLGEAFLAEVQHAVDALVATPLAGQAVDGDVRWWLVRRFPYSVFYRIREDHIREDHPVFPGSVS